MAPPTAEEEETEGGGGGGGGGEKEGGGGGGGGGKGGGRRGGRAGPILRMQSFLCLSFVPYIFPFVISLRRIGMEEKGKPHYDERASQSCGVALRRSGGRGRETVKLCKVTTAVALQTATSISG